MEEFPLILKKYQSKALFAKVILKKESMDFITQCAAY